MTHKKERQTTGRASRGLTAKQESFCLAYIETGNASGAYRRAFNAAKMKPATISKRASELMARGDIRGRLDELRAPAVADARLTFEQHLGELKRLRDRAELSEKFGPAIQAEIARGRAAGLYDDALPGEAVTVIEQAPPVGDSFDGIDLSKLSDEEFLIVSAALDIVHSFYHPEDAKPALPLTHPQLKALRTLIEKVLGDPLAEMTLRSYTYLHSLAEDKTTAYNFPRSSTAAVTAA